MPTPFPNVLAKAGLFCKILQLDQAEGDVVQTENEHDEWSDETVVAVGMFVIKSWASEAKNI